ncbi:hypothetical protein K443DRAFT_336702 [Laccaria amethystina LaAM-08-1]|uniref:Uncharacterized protein n=1 Tax=Laccaria amethystina LaAM-08-1 TaxID=1095629 RepID=A0A0C9XL09_9AGAR|nr:hypothetical protein K443DRAFT_336702 [Laccaria amethystina LaAM-08-1]
MPPGRSGLHLKLRYHVRMVLGQCMRLNEFNQINKGLRMPEGCQPGRVESDSRREDQRNQKTAIEGNPRVPCTFGAHWIGRRRAKGGQINLLNLLASPS